MKKFLVAAPLVLAASAALATPVSAATFGAGQLRSEIAQLDRQVDRANGLSRTESARLERQVDRLQGLYQRYARGGFSRSELRTLSAEVGSVKSALFASSRDRNGRDGWNDRDSHRDGRGDRDDHRDHDDRHEHNGGHRR